MYTAKSDRRNLVVVSFAVSVAFILIALHLSIQYSSFIYDFLNTYSVVPVGRALINFLFLWLALLLWLALRGWQSTAKLNQDLEAVISSISPDALIVINSDRTIRMCNDSVERLFGRKPVELIGNKTDLLYGDRRSNPAQPREIFEILARTGFHYGTATGKRKNGSQFPLEIITGELVDKKGVVLLIRDITERQNMEEQSRKLEQRALQAQKLESLGVLAGGVAHDFNNLLMIIQGHADLILMREPADTAIRDSILEIQRGGNRARELCRHLLSFAGRAPRDLKPVNLSKVAGDAASMLSVRIPPTVHVKLELAPTPALIEADESQIHQVALNLIGNACDAIGKAEGGITISTGEQLCDATYLADTAGSPVPKPGRYVFLRVADTGCGMDEATRRRVCEPFFTTKQHGTGMGLAAVLGIVRSHHGQIKVESQVGVGTSFTVLLTIASAPADSSNQPA